MPDDELNLLNRVLLAKEIVADNSKIQPEQYMSDDIENTSEIRPIPLSSFNYAPTDEEIKRQK